MSTEENKALVRRLINEVFGKGNLSIADEVLAPNFVEREELPPGISRDREGVKQMATMLRKAFPDLKVTVEDMIAEGDKVTARWTCRGTHKGELMGVPPTGKSVSVEVIDLIRVTNGKFAEHWGLFDNMGMMMQLGAIPAPGASKG